MSTTDQSNCQELLICFLNKIIHLLDIINCQTITQNVFFLTKTHVFVFGFRFFLFLFFLFFLLLIRCRSSTGGRCHSRSSCSTADAVQQFLDVALSQGTSKQRCQQTKQLHSLQPCCHIKCQSQELPKAILGTSGHHSSMQMVTFDRQYAAYDFLLVFSTDLRSR